VSVNGNGEYTGEDCYSYILVVTAVTVYSCAIKLIHSAWGLLRVCTACPTPRLNQSNELRPPWEQHLRNFPHRVRNGYDSLCTCTRNEVNICRAVSTTGLSGKHSGLCSRPIICSFSSLPGRFGMLTVQYVCLPKFR
jgi:hypothetical protein